MNETIKWLPEPSGEGPGSWAVCDTDGSVLDRYVDLDEARKDYPSAV